MDTFFYLLNLYFKYGTLPYLLNLAIAYHVEGSLPAAIEREALRCGLPEEGVGEQPLWRLAVYGLVAWPVGVARWLQYIFS